MSDRGRSALVWLAALVLTACGGGGDGPPFGLGGDLAVVDIDVAGRTGVALNERIVLRFSDEVAAWSVTSDSIRIRSTSPDEEAVGEFRVDGDVVEFFPRPPNEPDLGDAGLQPDRTYTIRLSHSGSRTVRSVDGERLFRSVRAEFTTVAATSPSLFLDDPLAEPPDVVAIHPPGGYDDVPVTTSIVLTFTEPLHPATVTPDSVVLLRISWSPPRLVPGRVELDQSGLAVVVRFIPDDPLENGEVYQTIVTSSVTDLGGTACEPFVQSFSTGGQPIPSLLTLDFGPGDDALRDDAATTAAWNTVVPGVLSSVFTGTGSSVGQSVWMSFPQLPPRFLAPEPGDVVATIPKAGQAIRVEVQLAREDPADPGHPAPASASAWTDLEDIESLDDRGYTWVRVRVTFTLPVDQTVDDPLPSVDELLVRYVD